MESGVSPYWNDQTFGRPRKYNPPKLWKKCLQYFKWCQDNKWMRNEVVKGGDMAGTIIQVPTERPFTLHGLCLYLGISRITWKDYEKRENFLSVTSRVRDIIYLQKFEGAAVGAFNHNLIARDLGLRDNVDMTSDGQKIEPITKVLIVHTDEKDYPEQLRKVE